MTLPGPTDRPDPERVLAQALRAMAGGGRQTRTDDSSASTRSPLSILQIVLIATILGLLVGMTVGVISLLA